MAVSFLEKVTSQRNATSVRCKSAESLSGLNSVTLVTAARKSAGVITNGELMAVAGKGRLGALINANLH